MKVSDYLKCDGSSCQEIERESFVIPYAEVVPESVRIVMIAEAPPANPADYFYAPGDASFMKTTLQAFNDAGLPFNSIKDIIDSGVYITTAIKCGKMGYTIPTDAVKRCSFILEKELALFTDVRVVLLMGDVAIKAMNYISHRQQGIRVIQTGSTYKIRKQEFRYSGKRFYPSYLMTGGNYLIEKTKRQMIAEDIKDAFITAGIR